MAGEFTVVRLLSPCLLDTSDLCTLGLQYSQRVAVMVAPWLYLARLPLDLCHSARKLIPFLTPAAARKP